MAKRRGNGEGSIYQRGDGKWVGSITVEGQDGKKRKVFYGKNRKAVQEKLKVALREQQQGTLVTTSQQSLSQYLQEWLQHSMKHTLRPRSYERYEEIVRLHITPIIGNVTVQDLTPQHVRSLQSKKIQQGLSSTTVSAIHGVLHKALDDAVKTSLIVRNVCDAVSPPRKRHIEIKPLSPDQAKKLLEVVKGHPQETLFTLALATGMRRGELLGLKWQDIDFENGILHVRRVLSRRPTNIGEKTGDRYVEAETKTNRSRRSIVIAGFALKALKLHRERQEEAIRVAGSTWQKNDYVFCTFEGKHLNPGHGVLVQLKLLLEKAGLPDIRFHDLRHSSATLLLSMGVHPKIVQEILGHSEISMTMDIYSHVLPTMQKDAMKLLNTLLTNSSDEADSLAEDQLDTKEDDSSGEDETLQN